jgi:hypothetical protein
MPCVAEPVRVLAAVTLKPALDAIAAKYGGGEVSLIYGPSPTLANEIENGVPADLFFSADKIWMNELAQHNLIKPETMTDLVGNSLVLIARKGNARKVAIGPGVPLDQLVGAGPLARCDPDSQPDGTASLASSPSASGIASKIRSRAPRTHCSQSRWWGAVMCPWRSCLQQMLRRIPRSRLSGPFPTTLTRRSSTPWRYSPKAITLMRAGFLPT